MCAGEEGEPLRQERACRRCGRHGGQPARCPAGAGAARAARRRTGDAGHKPARPRAIHAQVRRSRQDLSLTCLRLRCFCRTPKKDLGESFNASVNLGSPENQGPRINQGNTGLSCCRAGDAFSLSSLWLCPDVLQSRTIGATTSTMRCCRATDLAFASITAAG